MSYSGAENLRLFQSSQKVLTSIVLLVLTLSSSTKQSFTELSSKILSMSMLSQMSQAMRYRCKVCNVLCRLHHPGRRLSYIPLAMLGVVPPVPSFHQYYTSRMMDFEDSAVKYEKEKGGKAVTAPIMLTDHME